jgi:uncharacterized protein YndB with AHSA1/START domain
VDKRFTAKATIKINAPLAKVWQAFVNPAIIKEYMFGTNVVSSWEEGSEIFWKGEWQGKTYEDKGILLRLVPEKLIQYTHFSPMTGLPDIPENYHTVTIELTDEKTNILISLSQDNSWTEHEKEHSEKNWEMMLVSLKKLLEN